MDIRRNPSLWLALGIPVAVIVLLAAGIWLPRFFVKPPQYSFLYSAFDNSRPYFATSYDYGIDNAGKLTQYTANQAPNKVSDGPVDSRILYTYDMATHSSKQISFEDAQKLKLDSSHVSPDGYDVETGNSDAGFPFGGGGGNDQYIVKGSYSQRLEIGKMFGNTYYDFHFLGWVLP